MSIEFNWFLPTNGGDGRGLLGNTSVQGMGGNAQRGFRAPDIDYLGQVAQAAEYAGFHAVLIPTGKVCEDSWLVAAALARETSRLKFLVAFRPGIELPAYAAQKFAALQAFTDNRVLLNIVTGGDQAEQESYGDFLQHDERYDRTDEFLQVLRKTWAGPGQSFDGAYYQLDNGGLTKPLAEPPALYFGGASDAALRVAAKQTDVYLSWGEPPPAVAERQAQIDRLAAQYQRKLRYGVRLHILARATEAEAWNEAEKLLRALPEAAIQKARSTLSATQSVGQARMLALHAGRKHDTARDLEIYPNLWAGVGLVRGGAGTALVGSYAQVADRLREYRDAGVSAFILSGYPNLEEALRTGEYVLPLLR